MKVKSNRQSLTASLTERRETLWWRAGCLSSTEVTYKEPAEELDFLNIHYLSHLSPKGPWNDKNWDSDASQKEKELLSGKGEARWLDRAPETRPQSSSAVMTACQKPKWKHVKCIIGSVFIWDVFRAGEAGLENIGGWIFGFDTIFIMTVESVSCYVHTVQEHAPRGFLSVFVAYRVHSRLLLPIQEYLARIGENVKVL